MSQTYFSGTSENFQKFSGTFSENYFFGKATSLRASNSIGSALFMPMHILYVNYVSYLTEYNNI